MKELAYYQRTLEDVFLGLWGQILEYLPSLLIGIALLVAGYFLAKVSRSVIKGVASRLKLDSAGDATGLNDFLKKAELDLTLSDLLAGLAQLFIAIGFVLTAAEVLGLHQLSATLGHFLFFLPKIVACGAILLIGFWLAQVVYKGTKSSARSLGVDSSQAVASLVRAAIILVSLSLAIAQLDIDVTLLNLLVMGFVVAIVIAVALSFGLGTRDFSKEIVASIYVKDQFSVGDHLQIGELAGTVVSVDSVCTVLETSQGTISLPNSALLNQPVLRKID